MKKMFLISALCALFAAAHAADPNLVPMNKGTEYARLSDSKQMLLRGQYASGKEDTLLVFKRMAGSPLERVEAFRFSPTEDRLLLRAGDRDYYVYTFATKRCEKLSVKGLQTQPTFSRDGNLVAFLRLGDVYFVNLNTRQEIRVTNDGTGSVSNGGYVAQAYGTGAYMNFSPDGKYLVYAKNHHIYLYNIAGNWTYDALLPDQDIFISQLLWTYRNDEFLVAYLHRGQTELSVVKITIADQISKTKVNKIVNYKGARYIAPSNASGLLMLNRRNFALLQNKNSYNHLVVYTLDGARVGQMGDGKYDVTKIYGYDAKNHVIYYQSSENGLGNRGVYSVDLDGRKRALAVESGTNDAVFSSDFKYFELAYSNRTTPHTYSVRSVDGSLVRELSQDSFGSGIVREEVEFEGNKGWIMYKKDGKKGPIVMSIEDNRNQWMQDFSYFLAEQGCVVACVHYNKEMGTGLKVYPRYADAYLNASAWLIKHGYGDGTHVFMMGNRMAGGVVLSTMLHPESIVTGGIVISPVTNLVSYKAAELEAMLNIENSTFSDRIVNYVKKAGRVRGKLMLMHTINDGYFNVEDTYRMVEQLRELGMDADIQVVPVRDESMSGSQLQPSLFNQILRFVKTNSK